MSASVSLDSLLMYLTKNIVRALHYIESSNWERTTAFITEHDVLNPFLGCRTVKLHYRFDFYGQPISSRDSIPVLGLLEAEDYAGNFRHNLPVIVRVNPKNPQKTQFFDVDQEGAVRSLVKTVMTSFIAAVIVVAAIVFVVWISKKVSLGWDSLR